MFGAVNSIIPVAIGIGAGLIYGYSFVMQQRSIFFHEHKSYANVFLMARIIIISLLGSYLLRSPLIPSILGLVGFIVIFWTIILIQKASLYEGR